MSLERFLFHCWGWDEKRAFRAWGALSPDEPRWFRTKVALRVRACGAGFCGDHEDMVEVFDHVAWRVWVAAARREFVAEELGHRG